MKKHHLTDETWSFKLSRNYAALRRCRFNRWIIQAYLYFQRFYLGKGNTLPKRGDPSGKLSFFRTDSRRRHPLCRRRAVTKYYSDSFALSVKQLRVSHGNIFWKCFCAKRWRKYAMGYLRRKVSRPIIRHIQISQRYCHPIFFNLFTLPVKQPRVHHGNIFWKCFCAKRWRKYAMMYLRRKQADY